MFTEWDKEPWKMLHPRVQWTWGLMILFGFVWKWIQWLLKINFIKMTYIHLSVKQVNKTYQIIELDNVWISIYSNSAFNSLHRASSIILVKPGQASPSRTSLCKAQYKAETIEWGNKWLLVLYNCQWLVKTPRGSR